MEKVIGKCRINLVQCYGESAGDSGVQRAMIMSDVGYVIIISDEVR